jgi:lysophospholipase L1-like esterase
VYAAGARNVIMQAVGDSLTAGQSAGIGTAQAINSVPAKLAVALSGVGIVSASSNGWADRGSWGLAQTIANFLGGDGRFGATAGMALGSSKTPGGNAFNATAAGTLTFTAQANGDTCEFFWRDGAAGRNVTWQVDGGAATAINSSGVTQLVKTTIPLGAVGAHTITINWSLGSVTPIAFNVFDSTRKEISVWNFGVCGITSAGLLDNTDASISRLACISNALTKPDAVILNVGTNDWRTSVSVIAFQANLVTLVQAYQAVGATIILRVPAFDPSATGNAAIQQQYIDAMYSVAVAFGLPIVNVRLRWGSNAAAVAAGFQNPGDVHPTPAGNADEVNGVLLPAIRYALAA